MNAIVQRRELEFASVDDVIHDVRRLRGGYQQAGNWSLPQICWHLNAGLTYFMTSAPASSVPPVAPETRQRLARILSTGQLPTRIESSPQRTPGASCSDADVDTFLASLERFKTFAGPYSPHARFGPLTNEEGFKLMTVHCAHHLSHLVPGNPA